MAIVARIVGLSFLAGLLGGWLGRTIFEGPESRWGFGAFGFACVGAIVGAIAGAAREIISQGINKPGTGEDIPSAQT